MHRRAGDGAVISEQRLAPQTALVARRPDTDAAPLTALSEATDGPGLSNAFAHQLRADAVLVSLPRARQLDALVRAHEAGDWSM